MVAELLDHDENDSAICHNRRLMRNASSFQSCVKLLDILDLPKFRAQFYNKTLGSNELKWVLFTGNSAGSIGKIVFTIERGATAHVKSISVNKNYRGYGLGRILFNLCLSTLTAKDIRKLTLEAEEDTNRHERLVKLYENWGFRVIRNAKILFLYNGNECFRKIPMELDISMGSIIAATKSWFCMLSLTDSSGKSLVADESGKVVASAAGHRISVWETWLEDSGKLFLRSAHGKFLCAEITGNVVADRCHNSTWETFELVPHTLGVSLRTFHGNFLGIDPEIGTATMSPTPLVWGALDKRLVCNQSDCSISYRLMRMYNHKEFVGRMMEKYGSCNRRRMTIKQAFSFIALETGAPSIADCYFTKRMIHAALKLRSDGHPDWLQLAGLIHGLGCVMLHWIDDSDSIFRSIPQEHWLGNDSSWVVGCRIPDTIIFPELNKLNPDEQDDLSRSQDGIYPSKCGLSNVQLTWSPNEYLYHMLRYNQSVQNQCSLPIEALDIIRLRSCKVWYEDGMYENLMVDDDYDIKEWVRRFVPYTQRPSNDELDEIDVLAEWHELQQIIDKYLPGELEW